MTAFNVDEAESRLCSLIDRALAGEKIFITDNGDMVLLVPVASGALNRDAESIAQ